MSKSVGKQMHKLIKRLETAFRNPWLELFVGVVLILTGFAEAGETIFEDISGGNIGSHHGVMLLGLAHALKAVPSLLTGLMLFVESENKA